MPLGLLNSYITYTFNHTAMKLLSTCLLALGLVACASDPIDPLNPSQQANNKRQPHCQVGYEPVYATEIIIKSDDEDKKTGTTQPTYKCEPIR